MLTPWLTSFVASCLVWRRVELVVEVLDLERVAVDAARGVDLLDLDLRGRERRRVERRHVLRRSIAAPITIGVPAAFVCVAALVAPAVPSTISAAPTSAIGSDSCEPHTPSLRRGSLTVGNRAIRRPLPRREQSSRPRRARSATGMSQSESGCAVPNVPLSEKISRSYRPCQPASSRAAISAGTSAMPVAGQHPVGPAARVAAHVADVHAGDAVDLADRVVGSGRAVPEVPDVELEAERR